MKTRYTVALAMFAGFGLGAVAFQGLHAQGKPPVYQVVEIDAADLETYMNDYAPRARAAISMRTSTSVSRMVVKWMTPPSDATAGR